MTDLEVGRQVRLNESCACIGQGAQDECFHKICVIVRFYRDGNVLIANHNHVRLAAPTELALWSHPCVT